MSSLSLVFPLSTSLPLFQLGSHFCFHVFLYVLCDSGVDLNLDLNPDIATELAGLFIISSWKYEEISFEYENDCVRALSCEVDMVH